MYEFSATVIDNKTIHIKTNTYWRCRVEGNFMLSEYSREYDEETKGECDIDILIPDDVPVIDGTVQFSYGDERCLYPVLYVHFDNECYITSTPSYELCDDEKRYIYFNFEEENETFYAIIYAFEGWSVENSSNVKYIKNEDELMIISQKENGDLTIAPEHDCEGKNKIYIKLVKKEG